MGLIKSLNKDFFLCRARLLKSSKCLIGEVRVVGTDPKIYCNAEDGIPSEEHVTKVMLVEPSTICRFTGLYLNGSEDYTNRAHRKSDVNDLIFEGDIILAKDSKGDCFWYLVIQSDYEGPKVFRLKYDMDFIEGNFFDFEDYKIHSVSSISWIQSKAQKEIVYNIYTRGGVKKWKN